MSRSLCNHTNARGWRSALCRALVPVLLALVCAASASAAQITYVSIVGNWHDPLDNVPGVQPGDPVITNGNPTSIIRWGTTSGTPQSGYDFTATIPPPQTFPGPAPLFSLGSFTHRNFEVSDPSLTSVKLDVVIMLDVDGVPTGPLTFTFTFNHEETPNNLNPCPYPTPPGEGCTDRVTIVQSATPTTFKIGGVDYTLSMNFLLNGNPVSEFITREGGVTNTSGLVGQFTLPPGTPALTVTKSGPTTMNLAEPGDFKIDAQNTGVFSAYNATLIDRLPTGATGGMCSTTPQILSARVFAADGVTPVPGKAALVQGTDYSFDYNVAACELTLTTLTAASVVGVGERLVITYRTQLDAGTQNGITLTNVVGATQWYNDFSANPGRSGYTRTLTDGTPGTLDHEDAHTVTIVPRWYAEKAAALQIDSSSPGIVDAGDTLRYTIRVHNYGVGPLTHAMLRDVVPANTTYVADSMTLNGLPVGRPDGGVSPLIAGLDISSSNLTPPLPASGAGTLSGGQMAVVQFDLRVNDGVPPGTVISNQAVASSAETPNLPTDGDGNPATGPEPTVVVVGNLQTLKIEKAVSVVGGGAALAGATLDYVVTVTNIGTVPAVAVVIKDDIAVPQAGYLTFVAGSWTMNGSVNGITVVGSLLTADFSTMYGPLQPGRSIVVRFRAVINPTLALGTRITNTGTVYWNNPAKTASASVSIDVGGTPGTGLISGRVWHDADFDAIADDAERKLQGWTVELYLNGTLFASARTAADGVYRLSSIEPNYGTTDQYELRFKRPGAGPNTAMLGRAHSQFTNGLQRITDIVVISGSNLVNLDLPIDPNGVVYDSLSRTTLPGATLTLVQENGGAALPPSCFYDAAQQDQVTLADGYYKFDLSFADPACPSGAGYVIRVKPPSSAYIAGPSEIIPPLTSAATASFAVPTCPATPADAVPTTNRCEAQPSEFQPPDTVPARSAGTSYYLHLLFDNSVVPASSQIFNNHIPLDLNLDQSVTVTKTTPLVNVTRGQLVPYVITVANGIGVNLSNVAVVDRFPLGFRYVPGSGRVDGVAVEPVITNRDLTWRGLSVTADGKHTLMLLLAVGSGVSEGEFVNRAQAMHTLTGRVMSNEASATVRIVPDPDLDCTDVIGKVFDDANRNGVQDAGERGIGGVRLATARGLIAVTDQYGRFHITCAITPREGRGSNFVLKLDDRTLPSGFRTSTNSLQVKRATPGKALEFSFGASIHHVIGLDMSDPVFEPNTAEIRALWQPRIALLLGELKKGPAVLRLSYLADIEEPRLVNQRLDTVRRAILDAWKTEGSYELAIEAEVFWRRGDPPTGAELRSRAAEDARRE